jgi:hypothetical protein
MLRGTRTGSNEPSGVGRIAARGGGLTLGHLTARDMRHWGGLNDAMAGRNF